MLPHDGSVLQNRVPPDTQRRAQLVYINRKFLKFLAFHRILSK
jgi:hypothetical protein